MSVTIPRVDVLGVHISATTLEEATASVLEWAATDAREYVCVTGVHGVMESQRDPELLAIHNRSGMTTPDGMPMVWCSNWAGQPTKRVYGPDLMLDVCDKGRERGLRHFLYGSTPETLQKLGEALQARFPGLDIVGSFSPPFRALEVHEKSEIAARINGCRPDVVWVGLSTPKQERWMAEFRPVLDANVLLGVGAAFDMHAGNTTQAPAAMQRLGLEWAFRLAQEPRRLAKRYLRNNPAFVARVLRRPPRPMTSPAQ